MYATEDKNLEIIFTVNDNLCGDRVPAPAIGSTLVIEFTIHDPDEPDASYEVDVFADTIEDPSRAQVIGTYILDGNTGLDEVWTIDDVTYDGGT